MLTAVDLYNQTLLPTDKIYHIRPDWLLAYKLAPQNGAGPQPVP
jgi:hypothetical protein